MRISPASYFLGKENFVSIPLDRNGEKALYSNHDVPGAKQRQLLLLLLVSSDMAVDYLRWVK
jgi:hypothetical protein